MQTESRATRQEDRDLVNAAVNARKPPLLTLEQLVCVDCLFGITYDDYTAIDDDTRAAEVRAAVSAFGDASPTGNEIDFSWTPCDCCRSRLGGSRHGFVVRF